MQVTEDVFSYKNISPTYGRRMRSQTMHVIPLSSRTLPSNAASLLLWSYHKICQRVFLLFSETVWIFEKVITGLWLEIWGPIISQRTVVGSQESIGAVLGLPGYPQLGRAWAEELDLVTRVKDGMDVWLSPGAKRSRPWHDRQGRPSSAHWRRHQRKAWEFNHE